MNPSYDLVRIIHRERLARADGSRLEAIAAAARRCCATSAGFVTRLLRSIRPTAPAC